MPIIVNIKYFVDESDPPRGSEVGVLDFAIRDTVVGVSLGAGELAAPKICPRGRNSLGEDETPLPIIVNIQYIVDEFDTLGGRKLVCSILRFDQQLWVFLGCGRARGA